MMEKENQLSKDQINSFLDKVAKEGLAKLETVEQKRQFSQALRASITLDDNFEENSAVDIRHDFYFSIEMQKEYRISIHKPLAKEFLNSFGYKIKSGFDKNNDDGAYVRVYKKKPCKLGRSMVLTYAEWLRVVDWPFQLALPEVLIDFL